MDGQPEPCANVRNDKLPACPLPSGDKLAACRYDHVPTARNGTQARGRSLSLVIPAYNEEAVIGRAIAEARDALARLGGRYEILVVDDGSRDGTARVVAEAARACPHVRLLRHPKNRGYGAALRTGFGAARFPLVAFTDADCQFDLADLGTLADLADRYPLVTGYRIDRQDPPLRRFASWGYNVLVRTLLGTRVRDCDCALKVFRREALARLLPQTGGFFVNTEMLTRARQLGYDVAEVGVRHRPRLGGVSKVSLGDIPRTLRALLPFWWSRVLFPGGMVVPAKAARLAPRLGAARLALLLIMAGLLFFSGLFGAHDWAARLVPGATGFLAVLVTYLWGRRTVGDRAALAGAFLLCLSARFLYLGRMLTPDGLLCLWVVSALATAHAALRHPGRARRWWFLSAALCGLAVLTGGPLALALVALPVLAVQALDPRVPRPRLRAWLAYGAVVTAVALPWNVLAASDVIRFLGASERAGPAWFDIPGLLVGMLPWILLLPLLVRFLACHSPAVAARRPAALGLFLLASLTGMAFFFASGGRQAGCILAVFPPLALALGCYLDRALPWPSLGRAGSAVNPDPVWAARHGDRRRRPPVVPPTPGWELNDEGNVPARMAG
jgi:dolichol-phosphate mannosyltransferase